MKLLTAFLTQTSWITPRNTVCLQRRVPSVPCLPCGLPASTLASQPVSTQSTEDPADEQSNDEDFDLSLEAFNKVKAERDNSDDDEEKTYDGYDLRDALVSKWGECYDVDFNRVDSFGFRKLYLNILPYRLGRRPWRHASELDYLCHLQAVVEILQKYNQLDYVLYQIQETNKKPIAGRSPIVAVPIRLDLTTEQVKDIIGY